MRTPYEPPRQSGTGQFVDAIFILILVYASLLAPLLLKSESAVQAPAEAMQAAAPTWESLKQNAAQAAQWEKLGIDPAGAKPMVEKRFDYTIDPIWLIATIVVILGYFLLVVMISEKDYKQVIAEKFGDTGG